MDKIVALAAVLLIGPVVGAPVALAQTTTAPNSGAGVPGLPGNKSGPPARPGTQFNVRPDQSNVPGAPGSKSGPTVQQPMGLQDRAQGNQEEDEDQDEDQDQDQNGFVQQHPRIIMMQRGYGHHRGHSMAEMRIIFSLMDADGDGTVSLQEWQAAQERVFKAMDADHDGTVTFEEMMAFFQKR
jgi:hypothetical protein